MAQYTIGIDIKDTIRSAMERWLYKKKAKDVKVSSFERLLTSYDLMNRYRISNVRLIDLCTEDVQDFIDKLIEDKYSMSTIKKQYNLLTGFIRYLIGEGVPVRPAYVNASIPKRERVKKPPKKVEAYDPDEQKRLKQAISNLNTTGANAALLMMETGARVGEILALKWDDIIWQRRAVSIHSTLVNLQSRKKCFVQDSAKSTASKRTIPLSKVAIEMLMRIRSESDGLIFTAPDGHTPIGYNTLRNQIMDVCEDAGVDYRGMHVFRHTFATNAFYKGCEIKILSKLLGHASVTITYNTYIHLYGDALEEMRSIVD